MKMYILFFILVLLMLLAHCQRETLLYELLQVDEKVNSDQLKKSFRRLSIKYHPDRNAGNQEMQIKYIQIKRAYQILIDVSKRITYNLHGESGLKQLQKNPLRKGGDFRTQMWLSLQAFYTGGPQVYSFRRGEICKHCKGTGDQGGQKTPCAACGGSGKMFREVKVKDITKKMELNCKDCGGSGIGAQHKCPVCSGQKITLQPRDLKFELERGMKQLDVIYFKGESEQGIDFYPGDVYVKLNQQPHPTFKRDGNDLRLNIDVSLKEAIFGFQKRITHLDGHTVYLEEIYDIQDGKVISIENEGMPIRGETDRFGNLLATININYSQYNQYEIQKIRKIFAAGRDQFSHDL